MSRKHRSLVEAYNRIHADGFRETAETVAKITEQGTAPVPELNGKTVPQTDRQTDTQAVKQSNEHSSRHSSKQTDTQAVKRALEQSSTQSDEQAIEQSEKQSKRQSIEQSNARTRWDEIGAYPCNPENPVNCLTETQLRLFFVLMTNRSGIIRYEDLQKVTSIPYGTVRGAVEAMAKRGLLSKQRHRNGRYQGFKYTLSQQAVAGWDQLEHSFKQSVEHSFKQSDRQSDKQALKQTVKQADSQAVSLDDDDSNIVNHHLSNEDLKDMFPKLSECGFRSEHLTQVIRAWNFKRLNLNELSDSLERAEWDVTHNHEIKSPCAYVLSALKNGAYSSPPGFKLKRQLQAEESLRIAQELQQTVEETIKAHFDHWWNIELSPEEREKIDLQLSKNNPALGKTGNFREIARFEYYRKEVFKS